MESGIPKAFIYISHFHSTFITKDRVMLSKHFNLTPFYFNQSFPILFPFVFLLQFLFLLFKIHFTSGIICQFAGYHSFLPGIFCKLFNKKLIIIVAGTESYSFPSINYGNFRKPILSWFTKQSFKRASLVLPVSKKLIEYDFNYYTKDFHHQGIKFFYPAFSCPYIEIPYGYNPSEWTKLDSRKEDHTFITIAGGCDQQSVFLRKGIDLIIEVAPTFPDSKFIIIGARDQSKLPIPPPNVTYNGYLTRTEIIQLLSESTYYLQLSIAEGFPNALCEAMLCECIPIGSDVAAIPEIIGETGYILYRRDIEELKKLLNALPLDPEKIRTKAHDARQRIISNFPISRRENELRKAIESVIYGV